VSSGQNIRDSRTAPKNFSAKPSSHASSGMVRKSPARVAPAQLIRMSQRLWRSFTLANSCSQPASVRRSPATVIGSAPPAPATVLAASARLAADDAASTQVALSRANATAIARPIPLLPPVMTTTLFWNSPAMSPVLSFSARC
jgi:hypothetical protein